MSAVQGALAKKDAEIEWLTTERDAAQKQAQWECQERERLKAEVERLRAALEEIVALRDAPLASLTSAREIARAALAGEGKP
jgi:uncharacterized coiled-coil DUF342 family protein